MSVTNWQQRIEEISELSFSWDTDLTNLSTFRMISRGNLIELQSIDALKKVVRLLKSENISYRLLGWGANQVLAPIENDVLLKLSLSFDSSYLDEVHDEYVLPASLGLNVLTAHAIKFSLGGWEVLTGIPASLGGALYMNAGTSHGEIKEIVKDVQVLETSGRIRVEKIGPSHYSYRHNHFVGQGEVIIGATLIHKGVDPTIPEKIRHYLELRKSSQPLATKNCGCVFQNASPAMQAGRLIDLTGLKGLSVGALRVSMKHANFIENTGGASSEDFHALTEAINKQIYLHWGVRFELEVKAL